MSVRRFGVFSKDQVVKIIAKRSREGVRVETRAANANFDEDFD
ncbi:MAG TPA: hypothetical protein VKK79_10270 [Candidatus Lokiarchaeia archaeon]|nr:hypothetical protein [Candidatus Lokiarchaeia archaeon]